MKRCLTYSIPVLFAASLLWSSAAQASIIFSNLGPSGTYDTANSLIVGNDFVGDNLAEGDTFQASSNAIFGDFQVALSCISACPDPFTVALTQDSGSDSPGTVIESFTDSGLLLGTAGNNNPLLAFDSVLHPTLTAGTSYWITVSSDLNDSIAFSENITGDTSDEAISTDGGAPYFSPSGLTPGAYQVDSAAQTAVTPEPDSFLLLASGLPLLAFARKFAPRNNAS